MRWLLLALLLPGAALAADALLVEAESLELRGDWQVVSEGGSVRTYLHAGSGPVERPAVGAIQLPAAGKWRLWARSKDYPQDRPGIRNYTIRLGKQRSASLFGRHGVEGIGGWEWEDGGVFDLPAGPLLIVIGENGKPSSRCDALVLSRDLDYHPSGLPDRLGIPAATKAALQINSSASQAAIPPVTDISPSPEATLQNRQVRFSFHRARSDGKSVIIVRLGNLETDPSAETYHVIYRPKDKPANLHAADVHPRWDLRYAPPAEVSAGGASVTTILGGGLAPWNAGVSYTLRPGSLRVVDRETVELQFPPIAAGQLVATWHVPPDSPAADITLRFATTQAGQFSLGYHAPIADTPDKMDFLLLPFLVQGRRLPAEAETVLDARTPTPLTLVNQHATSVALLADPRDLPEGWPSGGNSRYALGIRNEKAQAQPVLYSPVLGGPGSQAEAQSQIQARLSIWVQPGPWHEAYERIVQERYGLRDYRRPVYGSLSDAILNLYDLMKSGLAWDDRAKGPWNIESRNTVTQSSPLLYMSMYLLTGDDSFYRRYALPSLEFLLSRSSPHFAAVEPYDVNYYRGDPLNGPGGYVGATVWASAYAMTQGRTPVFGELCRRPPSRGNGHVQPFEDLLAVYRLTGDKQQLAQAMAEADRYIDANLRRLPTTDLGIQPFVNVSFVPDWEGLLHLYDATGEKRFLDASAEGARWLLTTLWVHPAVQNRELTIHPGKSFDGERHLWYFGDRLYRLGLYEKEDSATPFRGLVPPAHLPEQKAPEWQVSNVGLGLEQPVTFSQAKSDNHIMMSNWAPNLLRLAQLTGDNLFRTAARNATIGRFTNYPGYYLNGYTTVEQKPEYPTTGPDVTSLYYHHIPSFAAYLIDYLFTDAEMRSHGGVVFPAVRQNGYVWFDSRLYGHAPGKIYGHTAWPWLNRTAVTLDNINVDRVLAHGDGKFFVVLLNQTAEPQKVNLRFDPGTLGYTSGPHSLECWKDNAATAPVALQRDMAAVDLPPSGITVVVLDGVQVDIPTHRASPPAQYSLPEGTSLVRKAVESSKLEAVGTFITAPPFAYRDLYVFVAAGMKQCSSARLIYRAGNGPERIATVDRYPCEFTVTLNDLKSNVDWKVQITSRGE